MRTVILASLRTHTRRYLAAALAVVIGVTFVVTTGMLASSARGGLIENTDAPYRSSDSVVVDPDTDEAVELIDKHPDRTAPTGWALLPVTADGRQLSERVNVGPIATDKQQRWQPLADGRFPSDTGEAAVDVNAAHQQGVGVGDNFRVGSGPTATDVKVVGLVESPSVLAAASLYLTWPDLREHREELTFTAVGISGFDAPAGERVLSVDDYVTERQEALTNEVDIMATMLMAFAAIALFVGVLVIANTFSILFAQRLRDFALLRCVGATRRQVLRSVRLEALLLGIGASVLGVGVGIGAGYGLVVLIGKLAPDAPLGTPAIDPLWTVGGLVAGILTTLLAAWLPTRRATRVNPLEALRPAQTVDVRSRSGRWGLALGVVLLVAGVALLAASMVADAAIVMLAGGAAAFTGVMLLTPVVVPVLIRAVGRLFGSAGKLATANAVRNPRRTATTTASLLVGVTLTTAMLTGITTSRAGVTADTDAQHPLDVAVTTAQAIPPETVQEMRRTDGVEKAVAVAGASAKLQGTSLPVLSSENAADVARDKGAFAHVRPGTIVLPPALLRGDVQAGDKVGVSVGERTTKLRVADVSENEALDSWGRAALVHPQTSQQLDGLSPATHAVWVQAADDADPTELGGDLSGLAHRYDAEVRNGLADRQWIDEQLDIMTYSVVGLLGIAVLVALVGVGNTLGLSVIERAREHSLLRALGLTRRQLRRMMATEATLLTVAATVLGTVIGVAFAWVGVDVVVEPALGDTALRLPWAQLAAVVVGSGVAGVLACVLPARRAARTAPAAGLAVE